jgi:parallel beta-helix repeat protein
MKYILTIVTTLAAISLGTTVASAGTCDPVLTPGEDLTKVATNCPGSTTYTIKDGAYKLSGPVEADSGDTFEGIYSDGTRPTINANGATSAFQVKGTDGVTIQGLDVTGTKGGDWCEPGCGSAIKGDGTNLHVVDVRLHHNPNQGIGNPGDGLVLEDSVIDHNGSYSFTVLDWGDSLYSKEPSSSAGVKLVGSTATFRNNEFHDNYWTGIWCDDFGGPIVVTGNRIYDNGRTGIQYEICRGGSTIKNNTVIHNGYLNDTEGKLPSGIFFQSPQSVEVANNTLQDNNGHGIHIVDGRSRRQRISGVKIHHNRFRDDTLEGCDLSGVECTGQLTAGSAGEVGLSSEVLSLLSGSISCAISLRGGDEVFTAGYGIYAHQLLFRSILCALYNVHAGRAFG